MDKLFYKTKRFDDVIGAGEYLLEKIKDLTSDNFHITKIQIKPRYNRFNIFRYYEVLIEAEKMVDNEQ